MVQAGITVERRGLQDLSICNPHPPPTRLGRRPAARHFHPLGETAALLALDVHNVRVASAPAPDAILLDLVRRRPVLILFDPLPLVFRRLLEPRLARQLPGRRVGRAVLDGRVPIPKVPEVVDVARSQKGTGCQRMDRRVTPLEDATRSAKTNQKRVIF